MNSLIHFLLPSKASEESFITTQIYYYIFLNSNLNNIEITEIKGYNQTYI